MADYTGAAAAARLYHRRHDATIAPAGPNPAARSAGTPACSGRCAGSLPLAFCCAGRAVPRRSPRRRASRPRRCRRRSRPARPGASLPRGWEPVKLTDRKKPTDYTLVDDDGIVVLHANAVGAASGLAQFTVFDIRSAPVVEWRWKVSALIEGADNRVAAKEDSPVRLLFAFDGDKSRLPFVERAVFYLTEKLSGRAAAVRAAPVRVGRQDSGRHGDRASVHAPGAHAGRGERPRRRRQVAIAVAQPATTTSATRSARSRAISRASAC